jgi:glycosyltransferase involved in cell wall biosynthesis
MFVSVLLPTRGRTESVKSSIESLLETAIEPENIEILFRLDDDDDTDPEELQALHTNVKIITGPRLKGYQSLDIFYNELCEIATGEWLFLWNDDAVMLSDCWDLFLLEECENQLLVQVGEEAMFSNHNPMECFTSPFPIMNKRYYEILGHFSLSYYNDTYVGVVMMLAEQMCDAYRNWNGEPTPNQAPIRHIFPNLNWKPTYNFHNPILYIDAKDEILVRHLRADLTGDNDDATWREGEMLAHEHEDKNQHFHDLWHQMLDDALKIVQHYSTANLKNNAS